MNILVADLGPASLRYQTRRRVQGKEIRDDPGG